MVKLLKTTGFNNLQNDQVMQKTKAINMMNRQVEKCWATISKGVLESFTAAWYSAALLLEPPGERKNWVPTNFTIARRKGYNVSQLGENGNFCRYSWKPIQIK